MPSVARASGPNTVEGKRKVSQNARKHGFRAKVHILSPIQETEIAETIQFFARDFPPQSAVDDAVLSQLGKAFWTLQQFDNLEAQQYISLNYEEAVRRLSTLTRYRAHYERLFHKAMKALHSTNKLRLKRTPTRPNLHKQTHPPSAISASSAINSVRLAKSHKCSHNAHAAQRATAIPKKRPRLRTGRFCHGIEV